MQMPALTEPAATPTTPERAGANDRRHGAGTALTAEELALIASCGESIRGDDWDAIGRAGLATRAQTPAADRAHRMR